MVVPSIDGVDGDGAPAGVPAADPHNEPMGLSSSEMRLTAGLNGAGIGLAGVGPRNCDGDAAIASIIAR